MSKKMKVLIAVLAAVLVLGIAGTTIVMAQEPPPGETRAGLIARVADILGISRDDLADAFKQAQQERRELAFQKLIERAVEKELITPGEAEDILEWWEDRPEAVDGLLLRARIFNTIRERRQIHQQGIQPMQGGPATSAWLSE